MKRLTWFEKRKKEDSTIRFRGYWIYWDQWKIILKADKEGYDITPFIEYRDQTENIYELYKILNDTEKIMEIIKDNWTGKVNSMINLHKSGIFKFDDLVKNEIKLGYIENIYYDMKHNDSINPKFLISLLDDETGYIPTKYDYFREDMLDKYKILVDNKFHISSISVILKYLVDGLPFVRINMDHNKYDSEILDQILAGFHSGIDISLFLDKGYLSEQLYQIRLGLFDGHIDIERYADPSIGAADMDRIRQLLIGRCDKKELELILKGE